MKTHFELEGPEITQILREHIKEKYPTICGNGLIQVAYTWNGDANPGYTLKATITHTPSTSGGGKD